MEPIAKQLLPRLTLECEAVLYEQFEAAFQILVTFRLASSVLEQIVRILGFPTLLLLPRIWNVGIMAFSWMVVGD